MCRHMDIKNLLLLLRKSRFIYDPMLGYCGYIFQTVLLCTNVYKTIVNLVEPGREKMEEFVKHIQYEKKWFCLQWRDMSRWFRNIGGI